jgi:hypothetical protein
VWDNIFPFFDYYLFSLIMTGAQAGNFDPKYKPLDAYREGVCDVVGLTVAGNQSDVSITMKIISRTFRTTARPFRGIY